jgi:1-acyl-sn-glycerol-3-phosphate acyltransferase
MKILRAAWFIPFFWLNTAVLGLLSLVASLWSPIQARAFAPVWAKLNTWAVGVTLKVEGLENLPPNMKQQGGVIVAANHNSSADIGAILAGLPVDVCWVTKAQLLKVPFLGWHLKRVHIPVSRRRGHNIGKLLENGAQKICEGATVVIFPEGTRNMGPNKLLPFKKGAFVLAIASGRPVVPVAITGSVKVWPPYTLIPVPGTITVKIGSPIDSTQYTSEQLALLADNTRRAIEQMLPEGFPKQG